MRRLLPLLLIAVAITPTATAHSPDTLTGTFLDVGQGEGSVTRIDRDADHLLEPLLDLGSEILHGSGTTEEHRCDERPCSRRRNDEGAGGARTRNE